MMAKDKTMQGQVFLLNKEKNMQTKIIGTKTKEEKCKLTRIKKDKSANTKPEQDFCIRNLHAPRIKSELNKGIKLGFQAELEKIIT